MEPLMELYLVQQMEYDWESNLVLMMDLHLVSKMAMHLAVMMVHYLA